MAKTKQRYSAQHVANALIEARGLVSFAARRLGCSRGTVYNYAKRYSVVRDAIEDAREDLLDTAELQLAKQIQQGNITAIIFTLKTIGKHRGYIERHDIGLALSPETMAMASELGISKQDIVREFEALIRAEAERVNR